MPATKINLGKNTEVGPLFSYPPNSHEVCFIDQTLAETISHYLNSSLARDGYGSSCATVSIARNIVTVSITGPAGRAYKQLLPRYLAAGKLGLAASRTLRTQDQWRYNWRFFLPHGIAMTNHRSVQLLHFPPDYVLERDQDYLSAHTTVRWAALLVENGADASSTASYQNIIDIAPIAAPSADGHHLDGVYVAYNDYIVSLMKLWLPTSGKSLRPMIAFGSPVRKWLKRTFNVDLDVLAVTRIAIDAGRTVPTLGANHPSFIYNAVKRLADDPGTPEDERVALGMRIMQQDLVAANWQVVMATDPSADPLAVLRSCQRRWERTSKQARIRTLTYQQVFDKEPEETKSLTRRKLKRHASPRDIALPVLDRKIEQLRQELGASESAPPPLS